MEPWNRARALELMQEYTTSESLRRHMYAVEAAMRAYARRFGGDEEMWGIAGLLHDFDYERYPNDARDTTGHPFVGVEMLKKLDCPAEICEAIMGHADYSGVPRTTQMAKVLYAVDELCGFIVAAALVRPTGLVGLEPSSIRKKLKDKAFAAKVNRDDIKRGVEELGIEEAEHFRTCIGALQGIAQELGFS